MLNCKRDADDGDGASNGGGDVTDGEPNACEDKPKNVAQKSPCSCADVFALMQCFTADRLFAERETGKLSDDKARFCPWNADDAYECDESEKPPRKPHENTAEEKPNNVTKQPHMPTLFFLGIVLQVG